jgi:hypothetical protein
MAASGKGGDINLNPVQTTVAGMYNFSFMKYWKNNNGMLPSSQLFSLLISKNGYFTKLINKIGSSTFV